MAIAFVYIQHTLVYMRFIMNKERYKVICNVLATLGTPLADRANK